VAMAEDLRVVFLKLADRLHNMRTLDALSPEKQLSIARETLEIYAPLAHRLGIWELKWQLEDLSFRYLEPEEYRRIADLIDARRAQRESFIARIIRILGSEFGKVGLVGEKGECTIHPSDQFIRNEITVVGSWYYNPSDYCEILDLHARGLQVDDLVTHRFPLSDAEKAFATFASGESGKVLIVR